MRRREQMAAVSEFASSVVADAIRRQPLSPGKVSLAWQMAAGPTLARASHAEIDSNTDTAVAIAIRARDARWAAEIDRLRPTLTDRLALLLGRRNLSLRVL